MSKIGDLKARIYTYSCYFKKTSIIIKKKMHKKEKFEFLSKKMFKWSCLLISFWLAFFRHLRSHEEEHLEAHSHL